MICTFIDKRMASYVSGGMKPETAAHFTRGELGAIYRKQHYSRDGAGVMRLTPPPEKMNLETVMRKCDFAIKEAIKNLERRARHEP